MHLFVELPSVGWFHAYAAAGISVRIFRVTLARTFRDAGKLVDLSHNISDLGIKKKVRNVPFIAIVAKRPEVNKRYVGAIGLQLLATIGAFNHDFFASPFSSFFTSSYPDGAPVL
jgi:hypothetical protein